MLVLVFLSFILLRFNIALVFFYLYHSSLCHPHHYHQYYFSISINRNNNNNRKEKKGKTDRQAEYKAKKD